MDIVSPYFVRIVHFTYCISSLYKGKIKISDISKALMNHELWHLIRTCPFALLSLEIF